MIMKTPFQDQAGSTQHSTEPLHTQERQCGSRPLRQLPMSSPPGCHSLMKASYLQDEAIKHPSAVLGSLSHDFLQANCAVSGPTETHVARNWSLMPATMWESWHQDLQPSNHRTATLADILATASRHSGELTAKLLPDSHLSTTVRSFLAVV